MKNIIIQSDECLEINNEEEYNEVRHMLRNPSMDYKGPFPIYFENADSVSRGSSIGIIDNPVSTWTGESLQIIKL